MSKKDADRIAYEERAAEIRRQHDEGKSIMRIMADQHAARQRELLKRALEQDEQDKR